MTGPTFVKIGARRALLGAELSELWRYRELLYFLAWRDVKIRYKQTLIGVAWVVLQPIITVAIFTVLFARIGAIDTGAIAYPVFAFAGLLVWLFTHTAVTAAGAGFLTNTNLVTKVYFPRVIVPLAATLAALFDVLFMAVLFAGFMVYYGVIPTAAIVLAPVFFLLAFILAAAAGILLSALTVKYRDVKFALPFALQVWMIASPVFYPAAIVSEKWRLWFGINPLTGIIEGFRSSLFGTPFDWPLIAVSCISLLVICSVSLLVFTNMEDELADVI